MNIREFRKKNRIPAEELAGILGISPQTYYKKESGYLRFSLAEARAIANHVGQPIEAIFYAEELPETDK